MSRAVHAVVGPRQGPPPAAVPQICDDYNLYISHDLYVEQRHLLLVFAAAALALLLLSSLREESRQGETAPWREVDVVAGDDMPAARHLLVYSMNVVGSHNMYAELNGNTVVIYLENRDREAAYESFRWTVNVATFIHNPWRVSISGFPEEFRGFVEPGRRVEVHRIELVEPKRPGSFEITIAGDKMRVLRFIIDSKSEERDFRSLVARLLERGAKHYVGCEVPADPAHPYPYECRVYLAEYYLALMIHARPNMSAVVRLREPHVLERPDFVCVRAVKGPDAVLTFLDKVGDRDRWKSFEERWKNEGAEVYAILIYICGGGANLTVSYKGDFEVTISDMFGNPLRTCGFSGQRPKVVTVAPGQQKLFDYKIFDYVNNELYYICGFWKIYGTYIIDIKYHTEPPITVSFIVNLR